MLINLKSFALLISTVLLVCSLSLSPVNVNAISPPVLPRGDNISNLATIHATSVEPGDYILADFNGLYSVTPGGALTTIAITDIGIPRNVAIDSHGNYIVINESGRLLSVTPGGTITTIAIKNSLGDPYDVAIDSVGNYIVTNYEGKLLSVTPGGVVTTIASDLGSPNSVAIDSHGDYFVTDLNGRLLSVTPGGVVTTIASGLVNPYGSAIDSLGNYITTDGSGRLLSVTPGGTITTIARDLGYENRVTIDSHGNYIVTDLGSRLLSVTPGGVVTTIASGIGFGSPNGIAIDSHGNYIVTDLYGRLLSVTPGGVITTIAIKNSLGYPESIAIDSLGNYIVTYYPGRLLSVTPEGVVTTIASNLGNTIDVAIDSHGNYIVTDLYGRLLSVTPGGIVTTIASSGLLWGASSVTIDSHGNYIVIDRDSRLVSVTPGGIVTTIASSVLGDPYDVAIDSHGNYIVTDLYGRLLSVTPGGVITTIASNGLGSPSYVAIDSHGNYIVAHGSGALLSVTPGGVVTTIATSFGLSLLDIAIVSQNITGGNNTTPHVRGSENIYNPPSIGNDYHNQYGGGIKINGKPFDIKNYTTTIPQQVLQIDTPTTLEFKIYDERGGNTVHHVGMYLHFNGDMSIINSDTWIIWDKNDGIEVHDPSKIFSKVHVDVTPEANYFYITFTLTPQKSMSDSNLVMRMWDDKLASEDVPILGAIVIVDPNAPVTVKKIPTDQYGDYVTLEQILDKDGYETPLLLNKLHNMPNDYNALNIIWVYDKGIDKLTMVETDKSGNLIGSIMCNLYKKIQQPRVTGHDYFHFKVQQLNRQDSTQEEFAKMMEEQKAVKLLERMGMLRTNNFS